MRNIVVAGNWKMNMDSSTGAELVTEIRDTLEKKKYPSNIFVVLCPPFPILGTVGAMLKNSGIKLGAQNMHYENYGAFTGEVSASMLKSIGCDYVILGHSERRQYFHETDAIVNRKVHKAFERGLKPIICVGETLVQRETGATQSVVESQVRSVFEGIEMEQIQSIIIAYEPIWAIGTGKTATPRQAQEVQSFIRGLINEMYGQTISENTAILYGGSVNAANADSLFSEPDIDGGLIGGASLKAKEFLSIIDAAERAIQEKMT